MSPSPSTRLPFVQIATERPIIVKRPASCGYSEIALRHPGHARRVHVADILVGVDRMAADHLDLAAVVGDERTIVEPDDGDALELAESDRKRIGVLLVAQLDRDLADRLVPGDRDRRDVADQPVVLSRSASRPSPADPPRAGSAAGTCSPSPSSPTLLFAVRPARRSRPAARTRSPGSCSRPTAAARTGRPRRCPQAESSVRRAAGP